MLNKDLISELTIVYFIKELILCFLGFNSTLPTKTPT